MFLEVVFDGGGRDDMEHKYEGGRSLCQEIAAPTEALSCAHRAAQHHSKKGTSTHFVSELQHQPH